MPAFADNIINAFAAGRQIRDTKIRQQQEAEDRKLQQETMALQLKELKLRDKLLARQAQSDALTGLPANQLDAPGYIAPSTNVSGMATAPSLTTGSGTSVPAPTAQQPIPRAKSIQGIPELGIPDMAPQSMEEIIAARAADARRKAMETPFDLNPGQVRYGPGAKPGSVAEIAHAPAAEKPPGSLEQQIVDALKAGDQATVARLTRAAAIAAGARREPDNGAATLAQKAAAERWKRDELDKLEATYRAGKTKTPFLNQLTGEFVTPPQMDDAELERRKAKIQASYLEQIGVAAPAKPAAVTATPAKTKPSAAAVAAPAARGVQKDQVVTVKGKRIKVTKVYADGSFDGSEVKP